ncbi:MAG: hypothetical protein AAGE65_06065 [Planctomycetota bacterium]
MPRNAFRSTTAALLATLAVTPCVTYAQSDPANFTTVLNIPNDPDIPQETRVASDTQINLFDDGKINLRVDLGAEETGGDGIELNVYGGRVSAGLDAYVGSRVNVLGGEIGLGLQIYNGGELFVADGIVDRGLEIGTSYFPSSGASAEITGGRIGEDIFIGAGSHMKISGGTLGPIAQTNTEVYGIEAHGGGRIEVYGTAQIDLPVRLFSAAQTPSGTTRLVMSGGAINNRVSAYRQTGVDLSGGKIDRITAYNGSLIRIAGGSVEQQLELFAGSTLDFVGGHIGLLHVWDGASATLPGGRVDEFRVWSGGQLRFDGGDDLRGEIQSGGVARFAGGTLSSVTVEDGGAIELIGGEFALNGTPVTRLDAGLAGRDVLTGVLADGSFLAWSNDFGMPRIPAGALSLDASALPPPADLTPQIITGSNDGPRKGLRPGQSLTLVGDDATLPDRYVAVGASLNVEGGTVGQGLRLIGTDLVLSGGHIGQDVEAALGANLEVTGGRIDGGLGLGTGTNLAVSGGAIGSNVFAKGGNAVTLSGTGRLEGGLTLGHPSLGSVDPIRFEMSGGVIERSILAHYDATLDITGGTIDADVFTFPGVVLNVSGGAFNGAFHLSNSSALHLFGTRFVLDGVDLTDTLTPGEAFQLADRDVVLEATLLDGSVFHRTLVDASFFPQPGNDGFSEFATLTLTLVETVALDGDFDGSGQVEQRDLNLVLNNWGQTRGDDWVNVLGLSTDQVDQEELNRVLNHWGDTANAPDLRGQTVPEPATLTGLVGGLIAAGWRRGSGRAPRRVHHETPTVSRGPSSGGLVA